MFNLIEKFFIKRFAKKIVKLLPELKIKGIEIIEKQTDELLEKVKECIVGFIESRKNQP